MPFHPAFPCVCLSVRLVPVDLYVGSQLLLQHPACLSADMLPAMTIMDFN